MRRARGVIGFPAPASRSPVPVAPAVCLSTPSPATLRSRVHPLVSFAPLQSPPLRARPGPPGQEHLPWGSRSPSSRRQSRASSRRGSKPAVHPSSAFLTPSTASSARGLAGLFHPAATSRVLPPGACSSRAAVPARRRPLPSRRWHCSAANGRCLGLFAPNPGRSRHLHSVPPSGLCSVRESATDASVLPVAPARSPPGLSSSRFSVSVPRKNA